MAHLQAPGDVVCPVCSDSFFVDPAAGDWQPCRCVFCVTNAKPVPLQRAQCRICGTYLQFENLRPATVNADVASEELVLLTDGAAAFTAASASSSPQAQQQQQQQRSRGARSAVSRGREARSPRTEETLAAVVEVHTSNKRLSQELAERDRKIAELEAQLASLNVNGVTGEGPLSPSSSQLSPPWKKAERAAPPHRGGGSFIGGPVTRHQREKVDATPWTVPVMRRESSHVSRQASAPALVAPKQQGDAGPLHRRENSSLIPVAVVASAAAAAAAAAAATATGEHEREAASTAASSSLPRASTSASSGGSTGMSRSLPAFHPLAAAAAAEGASSTPGEASARCLRGSSAAAVPTPASGTAGQNQRLSTPRSGSPGSARYSRLGVSGASALSAEKTSPRDRDEEHRCSKILTRTTAAEVEGRVKRHTSTFESKALSLSQQTSPRTLLLPKASSQTSLSTVERRAVSMRR